MAIKLFLSADECEDLLHTGRPVTFRQIINDKTVIIEVALEDSETVEDDDDEFDMDDDSDEDYD